MNHKKDSVPQMIGSKIDYIFKALIDKTELGSKLSYNFKVVWLVAVKSSKLIKVAAL